jgi:hypothetical protein
VIAPRSDTARCGCACDSVSDDEDAHVFLICNWLAGSLSGPKSPIFRHTSQFFLTIALLWPAKNRFVWRKMDPFLAQTRPANQLPKQKAIKRS